jgi:hypothetical protein
MSEPKRKSLWGVGIFVLYSGFVVAVLVVVAFASLQEIQLVEQDYYQQELVFQEQIDRIKRTLELPTAVSFEYNRPAGLITINYPPEVERSRLSGSIAFMRPSNADLDHTVPVLPDSTGRQEINASLMAKGLWRVKALWKIDADEYYNEDMIVIQ